MTGLPDVSDAAFGYGPRGASVTVVSGVSFSISLGKFVLLVGPNDCGVRFLPANKNGNTTYSYPLRR